MSIINHFKLLLCLALALTTIACGDEFVDDPVPEEIVSEASADDEIIEKRRRGISSSDTRRSSRARRQPGRAVPPLCLDVDESQSIDSDEPREGQGELGAIACTNCNCDGLNATIACRAIAACGPTATVQFVSGNTCSVNDCRANNPCGGRTECMFGGQVCAILGQDQGVCMLQ